DVGEVTGVLGVAEDGDGLGTEQVAKKDTKHPLVRIVERLARTINTVHAETRHMEVKIEVNAFRGGQNITFSSVFRNAVVRNRLAPSVFGFRKRGARA